MSFVTCPCCGGMIEVNYKEEEGTCDTCMTFISAGEVFKDPDYTEEGGEPND